MCSMKFTASVIFCARSSKGGPKVNTEQVTVLSPECTLALPTPWTGCLCVYSNLSKNARSSGPTACIQRPLNSLPPYKFEPSLKSPVTVQAPTSTAAERDRE